MNYANYSFYMQADFSAARCPKQPSAVSTLVDQSGPPEYNMANASTVTNLYQEWKVGLGRVPSVEELEQRWGARWRPRAVQKTTFCRHKVILDKINRLIDLGQTPDHAVAQLEALPSGRSLRRFSDALRVQRATREETCAQLSTT